jgi:hypothetical protein
MIEYSVWFSFVPAADVAIELAKVRDYLERLTAQGACESYRLLRKRPGLSNNLLPPYQAIIRFSSEEQFQQPFSDVRSTGIHAGQHGLMIENVQEMVVETFEAI